MNACEGVENLIMEPFVVIKFLYSWCAMVAFSLSYICKHFHQFYLRLGQGVWLVRMADFSNEFLS